MADTQEQPTTQEAAVSQDAPTQPDLLEVPMNQQNQHHDEDAATEHEKQQQEQVQDSKEEQQVQDKKEEEQEEPQHTEDKKKHEEEQQHASLQHAETPTTPEQQDSQLVANQHVEHLPHDSTLGAQTTSTPQNQEYADLSNHATPVEEPAAVPVEEPVAVKTVPAPVPVEEVVAAVTPVEEPAVIATPAAVAPIVEPVAAKVTSSAASDLSELKIPDNIEVKTSVQVPPKVTPLRKTPSGVTEKMGESARQKVHEGSASAGSIAMQLISSLRATASEFMSLVLPGSPSFSFIGYVGNDKCDDVCGCGGKM